MGLLDFLRRKKVPEDKTSAPKVHISWSDGTVQEFVPSGEVPKEHPLDKLTPDGELPWGWFSAYGEELEKWEDPLPTYASASRTGTIDEKIHILTEMVQYYQAFKDYCYTHGECFQKYFSDSWGHCRKQDDDPDYIAQYKEQLDYLTANYATLKATENRKAVNMVNLDARLWTFISSNNGILQKDVYKAFDESVKAEIQNLLYQWAQSGKISRVKKGNTYIVTTGYREQ